MKWAARFLILAGVVSLLAAVIWWWRVEQVNIRPTRLAITGIAPDSRLVVAQQSVDFLLDIPLHPEGWHTSLLSFDVQAGFDLTRASRSLVREKDRLTAVYRLPLPEILQAHLAKEGISVLRDEKSGGQYDLIRSFKTYAQTYAHRIALERGVLEQARSGVRDVLEHFEASGGEAQAVRLEFPEETLSNAVMSLVSPLAPISLAAPADIAATWEFRVNGRAGTMLSTSLISGSRSGQEGVEFSLQSVGRWPGVSSYEERLGVLFDSLAPSRKLWIAPVHDGRMAVYAESGGLVYRLLFHTMDQAALYSVLPVCLALAQGLKIGPAAPSSLASTDDFWMNAGIWRESSLEDQRAYFESVTGAFAGSEQSGLWSIRFQAAPDLQRLVVTDEEGWKTYREHTGRFQVRIKEMLEVLAREMGRNDWTDLLRLSLGMVMDRNWLHRDRLAVFFDDRVVFFVPERLVPRQNKFHFSVPYERFHIGLNGGVSLSQDRFCFGSPDDGFCLESLPASRFLAKFAGVGATTFAQFSQSD